jgi:hypothetical protein
MTNRLNPLKSLVFFLILGVFSLSCPYVLSADDPETPRPPKPQSAWSLAHLYNIISGEYPLNNNDIDRYIRELPLILALNDDPSLINELLAATGWTENRLVYVTTKVGMGLILLLNPSEKGSQKYPSFARPSLNEEKLITEREPEIQAAFEKLIAASQKQEPAKKAPAKNSKAS